MIPGFEVEENIFWRLDLLGFQSFQIAFVSRWVDKFGADFAENFTTFMNPFVLFPSEKIDKGVTLFANKNICAVTVISVEVEANGVCKPTLTVLTNFPLIQNTQTVRPKTAFACTLTEMLTSHRISLVASGAVSIPCNKFTTKDTRDTASAVEYFESAS